MCYYKRVKVKIEDVSYLIEDYQAIENFERDLQNGFEYENYPLP